MRFGFVVLLLFAISSAALAQPLPRQELSTSQRCKVASGEKICTQNIRGMVVEQRSGAKGNVIEFSASVPDTSDSDYASDLALMTGAALLVVSPRSTKEQRFATFKSIAASQDTSMPVRWGGLDWIAIRSGKGLMIRAKAPTAGTAPADAANVASKPKAAKKPVPAKQQVSPPAEEAETEIVPQLSDRDRAMGERN